MSAPFLTQLTVRRSIYALSKSSPIPNSKITEIVNEALKHTPSSFNSQSTRLLVLFGEEHDRVWGFAKDAIKAIVPADAWPGSEKRLNGFQNAYGTVLFFDDRTAIQKMQEKFATYADRFPGWAGQSNAMTQLAIWTALELEGLGANLQHYNPLIDAKVAEQWGIPSTWELSAQLVFGKKEGEAGEKTFEPIEERVKVFGA